jgi:glycosyltransferase involved in cell wall biosynthesis
MQFGDRRAIVSLVIPCLNEEAAIGDVVGACLSLGVDEVVVVDGGSADRTVERAQAAGARVAVEPRRGYGRACAIGVNASRPDCEVLVFIDGDGSDVPAFLPAIAGPVVDGQADFVMGSRLRGKREPNSLTPQQIVAGLLAGALLRLVYGVRMSDMSPFRAIRRDMLLRLGMREMSYGWNLEMQMRAAAAGLRVIEIPVDHRRRRGGVSKVSGNLRAGLAAAATVCATFLRLALALRGSGGQSQRALDDAGAAHDAATAKQRVGAERPSGGIEDE